MSKALLSIAGVMFFVPFFGLLAIAIAGDIPTMALRIGGWSMAFAVIVAGLGAFFGLSGE